MSDVRPVFFFHLPKTGGATLRQTLVGIHGERLVSPKIPGLRMDDAARTYGNCSAISGHMRVPRGPRA